MDEQLRRAFQLAFFILGERAAALRVTQEAVATLDVALTRQDKRLYYAPGSRAAQPPTGARFRTKISLSELQLLQRLVYIAAEPEERRQETQGAATATWLTHYLKHLARITLKRNSFFVTLGVSRLLHNYTTPETMQIYALVVQDPARVRDDSYYRRRKAQLMRELQTRFGPELTVQRGARGEERFQTLPAAAGYLELAGACLQAFTPWETQCVVPAAFDPFCDELLPLRFRGGDPDAEHPIEASRFHAVLHPGCYERLLAALRLDAPAQRLELPQFQAANDEPPDGSGPHNSSRAEAGLSEEEMKRIEEYLAQQREQRKRFAPAWLRVVVDGAEAALTQAGQLRCQIAPDAELIEVYGVTAEAELRLAAHLLSYDAEANLLPARAELILEGGQRLSLEVQPQHDATGECTGALLAVAYRETAPSGFVSWWQQFYRTVSSGAPGASWKPALGFALLALLSAALVYLFLLKPAAPTGVLVRNATPTPAVSPSVAPTQTPTPQPSATVAPSPRPSGSPSLIGDDVVALDIRARDDNEMLTRSERAAAIGLLEAKKIYLEVSGAEQALVSQLLRRHLPGNSPFSLTEERGEADSALKVTAVAARRERLTITARLVDANGKVIWPLTPGIGGRSYTGAAEKIAIRLSEELSGDLKKLRQ
jgi:hypothetical protein